MCKEVYVGTSYASTHYATLTTMMVSAKLLPAVSSSPNSILGRPMFMRHITFGSSFAYAYGYQKLDEEPESRSLSGSGSNESSCSSSSVLGEVDVASDDDSSSVGSISSVMFSVGEQSTSSDECSYSYSLCFNSFLPKKSSPGEDFGTIDTSDYSNSTFDLSFMSRHAGLDYNGRTLPPAKDAASSTKANIASHQDLHHECRQHDTDLFEGARLVKEHLSITSTCPQLEKTFDSSDVEEDLLSTPTMRSPGNIRGVSNVRKGQRLRNLLRRGNPVSAIIRLTSPAA